MPSSISHAAVRRRGVVPLLWTIVLCLTNASGLAQAIRTGTGFPRESLPRNDDGFSRATPIGFTANFLGRTYSSLYVNNNGNVTFEGPLPAYVPFGLRGSHVPIIAPFFSDVDTRPANSGVVTYGNDTVDGHRAFAANYFHVGYFDRQAERLNTFQLVLIERADTGEGNFDIEFNYGQIAWDAGSASHNVAAVAGFSNGTGQASSLYELAGSMQNGAFLDNGANSLVRGSLNSSVPGRYIFQARSGTVARGPTLNNPAQPQVRVTGRFVARTGAVDIDLGTLREATRSCRPLVIPADHVGQVPFTLQLLRSLPPEHRLEIRSDASTLSPSGASVMIGPEPGMELCLVAGRRAPSSQAFGETWLLLKTGPQDHGTPEHGVELRIRWRVNGLSFWQRWRAFILFLLALLLLAQIVYGYIRPYRFAPGLALTFVHDYADLDESPQPLAQWRGVGIGFYRDARAYLHLNFRISREARGAVAMLKAQQGGRTSISPGNAASLYRELDIDEWQPVDPQGQAVRRGSVYRVGDSGPFFRITTRG